MHVHHALCHWLWLSIITGLDYWNGLLELSADMTLFVLKVIFILSNKIQLPVEPTFYQEWYMPGCTDSLKLS